MITVVKIGGNVVDNPEALARFADDFARLEGPKVLVHGGGKEATRLSARLDIPTTMIDGRRVTDRDTLDVVTMVYAGLINKRIVALLQRHGCNAIGLTGADGNLIKATRRSPEPIDFGYVGDIDPQAVNDRLLAALLEAGFVPVVCAITHDGSGTLLNSNADVVAAAVAIGASRIEPARLIYCFEMPGVMADVHDPDSVIPLITPSSYEGLKSSGTVSAGMIPKIDSSMRAVSRGVSEVVIRAAADLLRDDKGTTIKI